MKVPYLDLSFSSKSHIEKLKAVLEEILVDGRIVGGKYVNEFETLLQNETGVSHAVAVSSGTDAVWLALRLLGVGPGDEVITSALGWLGTVNPIVMCGAVPRFVDIKADLNLSPEAVSAAVTPKTKVILAVHYTGLPCDIDEIARVAVKEGVSLIEDCAQAYGARWQGRPVGSFGDAGAFSMNPMKLFSAIGEAGAVVFDKSEWIEKAHALRHNGLHKLEYCLEPSLNLKPDSLQCGFLVAKHQWLGEMLKRRMANANYYDANLRGIVKLPESPPDVSRVYYTYTIRAERRDELQRYLTSRSIESKVRHPVLLNEQETYAKAGATGSVKDTPEADRARHEILNLPVHENLTFDQTEYVCNAIKEFYGTA